jgi:quinol monooxygenase YgiN
VLGLAVRFVWFARLAGADDTRSRVTNIVKPRNNVLEEKAMIAKQLVVLGASMLAATLSGGAVPQPTDEQYVQMAEIEVDPVQLGAFRAAVREQIDSAIRKEAGVMVLYAVSEKDNPAKVKVFEIYRNRAAYESHLASDHFKKYKLPSKRW